jgi:hypothetical protein
MDIHVAVETDELRFELAHLQAAKRRALEVVDEKSKSRASHRDLASASDVGNGT